MEILAGLQNAAIYRLKKTWEVKKLTFLENFSIFSQKLEKSKTHHTFSELMEMMSSNDNYKAYRNKISNSVPPCIPYLGKSKKFH